MKITSKILQKEYDYTTKWIGFIVKDDDWPCDQWLVTIEGEKFDYYTGIGHKAIPPELDDVLYSLVLDSEALEEPFESWALNFGYSDDSIKAKEIYEACQKNAFKLKAILGVAFEEAREAFQDY